MDVEKLICVGMLAAEMVECAGIRAADFVSVKGYGSAFHWLRLGSARWKRGNCGIFVECVRNASAGVFSGFYACMCLLSFCEVLCAPVNVCSVLYVSSYWKLQGDEHFGISSCDLGLPRGLCLEGTLMQCVSVHA